MNKKRLFTSAICIVLVAIAILSLCACGGGNGISNSVWKTVGLKSSTLTLPELEIAEINSFNDDKAVAVSISWNNAEEKDFKALAKECFTKIPANQDENGNKKKSVDDLMLPWEGMKVFISAYRSLAKNYYCTVIYFTEDYDGQDFVYESQNATYKKGQLLLVLLQQTVQVGEKHSWDIDGKDKTWFTQEELAMLGLEGLEAPEGKILGKVKSEEFGDKIYMQMSIEIASNDVYYSFIQKLFDEYNLNMMRDETVVDSYDNDFIFFARDNYAAFTPYYKVGDKLFRANISLDYGHIVIQIGE